MIDLHHHLLPGIDDGPATLEESVAAARHAAADGVRTITATPHVREDHPKVRPHELARRCEELQLRLDASEIPIEVVPAGEVDLLWAQEAADEDLRLVSYAQKGLDLLVETPYGPLPATFEQRLFELQTKGYRLLLAHPERNPTFRSDPARLAALVDRGILLQVTAGALVDGGRSSSSRRLAQHMLESGLAHVIASDSHGSGIRRGALSNAVAAAAKRVGERAEWMVTAAPAAILAGDRLEPPPPARKRRRLFRG